MSGIISVMKEFAEKCTACGLCVECCPIVQHTELKDHDSFEVMEQTLELFHNRAVTSLARTRIYSCLFCNACRRVCPEGLYPGLSFGAAKAILRETGDPIPKGVAAIMPIAGEMIRQSPFVNSELMIRDPALVAPGSCRTVLFSSCFGLIQPEALETTLKIIRQIDPTARAFGGFDFCCGELQFMAGRPEDAEKQFDKLVQDLNRLAPERVVIFCPTCNMTFDHHAPDVRWSRHFVTDYVADHLGELSPAGRVEATVTVHDPCHYVRGIRPGSESPRKILKAIPGIRIVEMENAGGDALCCGAYAITGTGAPGKDFRNRRMGQAKKTGAEILSLYCPGCQMILGPEGPNYGLEVVSILMLLARSMGI